MQGVVFGMSRWLRKSSADRFNTPYRSLNRNKQFQASSSARPSFIPPAPCSRPSWRRRAEGIMAVDLTVLGTRRPVMKIRDVELFKGLTGVLAHFRCNRPAAHRSACALPLQSPGSFSEWLTQRSKDAKKTANPFVSCLERSGGFRCRWVSRSGGFRGRWLTARMQGEVFGKSRWLRKSSADRFTTPYCC
jgi:hypothetical protein